jgi:hypothetical protein
MSEIPFVNQLGDELERAAKRAVAGGGQRRRRRLGLLALAGALVISGSALAGSLLTTDAEEQAAAGVACYDGADPDFTRSVAHEPRPAGSTDMSPVDLCRRAGVQGPLVACGAGHGLAVIPGRRADACAAAGFEPLGTGHRAARARVAVLERRILAIEASVHCIAPEELARRVRRLLHRFGWADWSVSVTRARRSGPCGTISGIGGDGQRYISFWPTERERTLHVKRSAPRRISNLLYSAEHGLLARLIPESGTRCFTYEGLRAHVREVFAAEGIDASVRWVPFPANTGLDDEDGRWTRYQAGCAIVAGGAPGADGRSAVIEIFQKR